MRQYLYLFILLTNLFFTSYTQTAFGETGLTLFTTQTEAQKHCPNDEVVWLNIATGIWHSRGARWYGNTKHGAYVCKLEALAAGDRASLNG
jgi:hypothetical protein